MSTFLTADTHFGHANIIHHCRRPFTSAAEMAERLIANWNAVVNPKDTVWHLGDFAMKLSDRETAEIFHELNGRKHLIIGNHDLDRKGRLLQATARLPWESVPAHQAEIKHDGHRIVLSHYAGLVWHGMHRGSFQAFGHSHGGLPGLPGSIDVGVDVQNFAPMPAEEFVRQAQEGRNSADAQTRKVISNLLGRLKITESSDR